MQRQHTSLWQQWQLKGHAFAGTTAFLKNVFAAQELLGDPNPSSPAQSDAFLLFTQNRAEYSRRVRAQAQTYPPPS